MKPPSFISSLRPLHRLIISLICSGLVFLLPVKNLSTLFLIVIGWIIFAFVFTLTGWIILLSNPVERIKKLATTEDGSKLFVFVMILVASFASMFTVLLLMISDGGQLRPSFYVPVVLCGMMISWAMVHTTFAFHYAHMFYGDDDNRTDTRGLDFPGERNPDYIDFAYLSFVIGCTFQVSDVAVKSRRIRRMVLFHGLLSFVLNTFVVALTINLVASLNR